MAAEERRMTHQETLSPFPPPALGGSIDCVYQGAGERAGTYSVDARSDAREKLVSGVVVGHDQCHVIGRQAHDRALSRFTEGPIRAVPTTRGPGDPHGRG